MLLQHRGSWELGTRDDAVSFVPSETGFWRAALSTPSPQGQQDGWRLWHRGGSGPTAYKGHLKRGQDRWGQAGMKLLLGSPSSPNACPFPARGCPASSYTPGFRPGLSSTGMLGLLLVDPAVSLDLSPRSLVWLPGIAWSSAFSGDGGKLWARVARSALRYCSRVT